MQGKSVFRYEVPRKIRNFDFRFEQSNDKSRCDTLTRNKQVTFKGEEYKLAFKTSEKNEEVRIKKDVLSALLAESNKKEQAVDRCG